MRKIFFAAVMIVCATALSMAQSNDNKWEGFAGFSINSMDTGLASAGFTTDGNRTAGFGFDTSFTGYVSNRLGIEGDFDGHFRSKTFNLVTCTGVGCPPSSFNAHLSSFNFLGGPHLRFQTKDSKVTPFVHVLAGGNHSRASTNVSIGTNTETDFAMKFGGGIDFGWKKRAAIRVGADYNPIFQKSDGDLNPNFGSRRTRNDAVFNVGVVFK